MSLEFKPRRARRGRFALQRLGDVVRTEPGPACVVDRRGALVLVNQALVELLGVEPAANPRRLSSVTGVKVEQAMLESLFELRQGRHRVTARAVNERTREPLWLKWDFAASAGDGSRLEYATAFVEDQTGRVHADSHLRILQYIINAAGRAKDAKDLLYAATQVLCHFSGCGFGQVWLPDGETLTCSPVHYAHGYEVQYISRESVGTRVGPGEGVVGRAWQTGQTQLIEPDPSLGRSGVLEIVALPIGTSLGVAAVLELFVTRDGAPLDRTALIAKVGLELGEILERRLLNDTLQASEERFRAVAESAADAVVSADAEGRVISWNKAAEHMFGWAAHEVVNSSLTVIIPERYREMHRAGLARVAATGQSKLAGSVVELMALRRDGSEFPVELSIGVFDAVEGRGFSAVLRDISERKQAEEALRASEERFRSLADSAPDAIVSADAAGRVLSWNTGAEGMFGWAAEDMVGHPLTLIIPDRYRAAHIAGLGRVSATGQSKLAGSVVELVGLRHDGSEFPVELSIGVWESAQGRGFSGVLRDITDRKEAEEAVAQASREVERANAELETLIYSASHDLKSPMISVLGYLDYLKVDYGEVLGNEGTRYLERMTDCTLYMQRLIQDLLKLSRVGRLESEVVTLDLHELVARIADELGAMHPQASFSLRSMPTVEGDAIAFRQLFTNLVENAVQHADRPDVSVVVSSRRLPDGGAEISVRDNGKGIPQEYRELVFGIFERLEGGRAAGTGMGLAICRKIVEQFGGKIWVTGNDGADVRVHVPRSLVVEDRLPAMAAAANEGRA